MNDTGADVTYSESAPDQTLIHSAQGAPDISGIMPQPAVSLPPRTCLYKACISKPSASCSCTACVFSKLPCEYGEETCCRYAACEEKEVHGASFVNGYHHERSHFGKPGNYRCQAKYCPLANKAFKRWPDLLRHSSVAHCQNTAIFTCHVLGCKYREKGFSRKDKLTSHIKNVHTGKAIPGKRLRELQPTVKGLGGSNPTEG